MFTQNKLLFPPVNCDHKDSELHGTRSCQGEARYGRTRGGLGVLEPMLDQFHQENVAVFGFGIDFQSVMGMTNGSVVRRDLRVRYACN